MGLGLHPNELIEKLGGKWDGPRSTFECNLRDDTYFVEHLMAVPVPEDDKSEKWSFRVRKKRGSGVGDLAKEDWKAEVWLLFTKDPQKLVKWGITIDTGIFYSVSGLVTVEVGHQMGPKESQLSRGATIDVLGLLQAGAEIATGTGEKIGFVACVENLVAFVATCIH